MAFVSGTLTLIFFPQISPPEIEKKIISKPLNINISPIPQLSNISYNTIIEEGDNLYTVLKRINVDIDFQRLLAHNSDIKLDNKIYNLSKNLMINRWVRANFNQDGSLLSVDFYNSRKTYLRIIKTVEKKINANLLTDDEIWEEQYGGGIINSSLFATLDECNIPPLIATYIVDIFGTDIDFSKDLRIGDKVFVSFKRLFVKGIATSEVVITGVELTVRKKIYQAFLYPEFNEYKLKLKTASLNSANEDVRFSGGEFNNIARMYYDFDGKSVIRGFLRYPLEFTRISSGFTDKRFHPILHTMRAHTGTDFAAPIGTAVRASGDGVVKFIGIKGGYGNIIIINHSHNIESWYGHLNNFAPNLKKGDNVQQNQTIGFVGKTGAATGPHLHYEFRVNSRPQDPLVVVLPRPPALQGENLSKFINHRDLILIYLATAKTSKLVSID